MSWPILALLCALCQALADVLTRRFLPRYTAAEVVLVRLGLTAILLLPLVAIQPPGLPELAFWGWVGLALPLELLAMVLYMTAIRVSPLALTLPYLAFTPVFSALFGWLLLGELVSARGLVGVLLVVVGTWALNLERPEAGRARSWLAPLAAIGRERGSRLMLAVALIYSLTSVLGKGALQYLPATVFGPFYYLLLGLFTVAFFSWREPRAIRRLWQPSWSHGLIAALSAGMVLTHFLAIEQVQVAYMIGLKRTSILFGILLGALWLGETRLLQHLLAACLMVLGVVLIVL